MCRHPESHRGYRRHKPGYCYYTIAAIEVKMLPLIKKYEPNLFLKQKLEDPGIDPGSQPCEGCMLPCTTIPQTEMRPSGLEPES